MTDEYRVNCGDCKFHYEKENACRWAQWSDIDVPYWLSEMDVEVVPYKDRHCSAYKLQGT